MTQDLFRIIVIEGNFHLYYANGLKCFVRDFKSDGVKLIRFLTLNNLTLDDSSQNILAPIVERISCRIIEFQLK